MLLEAHDLSVSYGDIKAVNEVNFSIDSGELISIIGANGAGKTSILGSIMGIIPIKGGDIFIFFRPVFNLADSAITTGVIFLIVFQKRFFKKRR